MKLRTDMIDRMSSWSAGRVVAIMAILFSSSVVLDWISDLLRPMTGRFSSMPNWSRFMLSAATGFPQMMMMLGFVCLLTYIISGRYLSSRRSATLSGRPQASRMDGEPDG